MEYVLPSYTALVEQARQLGFDPIALVPYTALDGEAVALEEWLDQGFHADMTWMAEKKAMRLNPKQLMPSVQSICCVALNYYPGEFPDPNSPKIARYAQGDDYHDVIKDKLKALLAWLQTFDPAIEGRAVTDSAPILEKAWATRAGLAWQGKHSNMIHPKKGSWFFLGELLLNVTFPDAPSPVPMNNFCGSCRRCIEACPTQAIVEPYVVDANRCIAYWTIEHKGPTFPTSIQTNLNGWLFGCDICQEVCPWNQKFQTPTTEKRFLPRPWNWRPKAEDIAAMNVEQFRVRYRKSPVKRIKLSGLKRNWGYLEGTTQSNLTETQAPLKQQFPK